MCEREQAAGGAVPFETALSMSGFGVYSWMLTGLAGLMVISLGCISFGTTYIIPTSACELQTTTAQQGLISSAPLAGIILGAVIGGYLGDVYGRRRVLLYALLSSGLVNGLASLSVNWVMLVVLQTVASFCASGQFSIAMALLSESVPLIKRNTLVLLVNSMFILHQGIMAVIAMPVAPLPFSIYLSTLGIYWNSWRTLVLLFSVPSFLAAFWLLFLMESPKYLFAQGQEAKAIHVIKTIHRINCGKSAGDLKIQGLIQETRDLKASNSAKSQIGVLFKRPLLKYTIILTALFSFQQHGAFTAWMPTIANQFIRVIETGGDLDKSICGILDDGLEAPGDAQAAPCSLNAVTLYFLLILGVFQSGSNILLSLVVGRTGRRNLAMAVVAVTGAAGVLTALVPHVYASAALMVLFMLGVVVVGLYAAIAVALFPTHLRAFAIALTMTAGRLVTFAAVQILNLLLQVNCGIGFYLFNSLFTASALILLFLPDDKRMLKNGGDVKTKN